MIELSGKDVTKMYIEGAYVTLKKARDLGASTIVLKEYSPSCGSSMIYNGKFNDTKILGVGVTTALLRRKGLTIISEESLTGFLDTLE